MITETDIDIVAREMCRQLGYEPDDWAEGQFEGMLFFSRERHMAGSHEEEGQNSNCSG